MRLKILSDQLLALPRPAKRSLALGFDTVLCVVSVWIAFNLRLGFWVGWTPAHSTVLLVCLPTALPLFSFLGFYRAIFRYAGLPALMTVLRASAMLGAVFVLVFSVIYVPGVPRAIGVLLPLVLMVLVMMSRLVVRYWLGGMYQSAALRLSLPKVLIYGAGSAGRQLAAALKTSPEVVVAGYLDDDERLHGHVLDGHKIFDPEMLVALAKKLRVTQVYLAIPSVSRARRNEVLDLVRAAQVQVRTLPGLLDLAQGRVQVSDLKELDIEDLLGRDPVPPNPLMLAKNITGKVVMVTGAGGSIGSELCRQIVRAQPAALLLVELTEFALYAIELELQGFVQDESPVDVRLVPLLANVRDAARMDEILRTWRPDTVYHAAAYKHVPLVEHNPAEGIKNNVLGTLTTARLAAEHGVRDFVLISTDKAVRPTNVMGASKRLAEMVLQALASVGRGRTGTSGLTTFSMVRFGNVLGSSGSVVPLFRQQIKDGGPITLTDERITRYFMTIPEAAQLVIQAGAMANGGDVFVLDMGEPVKIIDLAKRMLELSGLALKDEANPNGDIAIAVTGLRPGEKLYEELLIGDNPLPTSHSRIMKAHEEFLPLSELESQLAALTLALDANNVPLIRQHLKTMVPGYQPDGEVVDWVWLENAKAA
jgi:FlaA1/EpsC-like NDP-sugar epimerase